MSSVEIVSRIEPRRKWAVTEKAALLAEIDAEGGRVTLVARRHRMSESLLYNWRSARKAAVAAASGIEPAEFLQLGVVGPASADRSRQKAAMALFDTADRIRRSRRSKRLEDSYLVSGEGSADFCLGRAMAAKRRMGCCLLRCDDGLQRSDPADT